MLTSYWFGPWLPLYSQHPLLSLCISCITADCLWSSAPLPPPSTRKETGQSQVFGGSLNGATQAFYCVASPVSLPTFPNSQHLLSLSTPACSPVKCRSPLLWIFFFVRVYFLFLISIFTSRNLDLFCFNYCSTSHPPVFFQPFSFSLLPPSGPGPLNFIIPYNLLS